MRPVVMGLLSASAASLMWTAAGRQHVLALGVAILVGVLAARTRLSALSLLFVRALAWSAGQLLGWEDRRAARASRPSLVDDRAHLGEHVVEHRAELSHRARRQAAAARSATEHPEELGRVLHEVRQFLRALHPARGARALVEVFHLRAMLLEVTLSFRGDGVDASPVVVRAADVP